MLWAVLVQVHALLRGKLIYPTNFKNSAQHFRLEVFLVAILFIGDHFFSEIAADSQDLLACKISGF